MCFFFPSNKCLDEVGCSHPQATTRTVDLERYAVVATTLGEVFGLQSSHLEADLSVPDRRDC